jgi:predicted Fe-Mo cluster-binding NifX family protein
MKIAVATEDGKTISKHFGRSPYFVIFEIERDRIINTTLRKNTFTGHFKRDHHEHQHGEHHHGSGDPHKHESVAEGLIDCQVVISHGMGRMAWEDLRDRGIEMIVTDETDVESAVNKYISGDLTDNVEKLH